MTFLKKADFNAADHTLANLKQIKVAQAEKELPEVFKLIADQFATDPQQIDIRFLPDAGTFHNLYSVKLLNNHQRFFVKTILELYNPYQNDLLIDEIVLRRLEKANAIYQHKIYQVKLDNAQLPLAYAITEDLSAYSCSKLNIESDKKALYQLVGKAIAATHQLTAQHYGLVDLEKLAHDQRLDGSHTHWQDYLLSNARQHLDICVEASFLPYAFANDIEAIMLQVAKSIPNFQPSLLHGDLNNHNIFKVNMEQVAILDWEDALFGDPLFDIASWSSFIGNYDYLDSFLIGYRQKEGLSSEEQLRFWLYYLRIIIAKTVVRYRYGYYRTDKIPAIDRIKHPLNMLKSLI